MQVRRKHNDQKSKYYGRFKGSVHHVLSGHFLSMKFDKLVRKMIKTRTMS